MSWNVEGLKENRQIWTVSYDFAHNTEFSLLCAQETKAESSHTFVKNGWEILMSGLPSSKHHGVGFFVSPTLRSHVTDCKPHTPAYVSLLLPLSLTPLLSLIYTLPVQWIPLKLTANRKRPNFGLALKIFMLNHSNSSHMILVGDCNSRLDADIDPTNTQVGPPRYRAAPNHTGACKGQCHSPYGLS